jgi:hypothetical protein
MKQWIAATELTHPYLQMMKGMMMIIVLQKMPGIY